MTIEIEEIRVVTIDTVNEHNTLVSEVLGIIRGPVKDSNQIYEILNRHPTDSSERLKEYSDKLYSTCKQQSNSDSLVAQLDFSNKGCNYCICIELFKG